MIANRSMPAGAVIPVLVYADIGEAVEWLCRAFGFRERVRIGDHRAQLAVGDGSVVVAGLSDGGPPVAGWASHSVMVRVVDIDRHYARAIQAGARLVSPPTDYPYGERQYSVFDLGGHQWKFSQTVADVHPSEWGGMLID